MFSFFKKHQPAPPDDAPPVQQLRTPSPSEVAESTSNGAHVPTSPAPSISQQPFYPDAVMASPKSEPASAPAPIDPSLPPNPESLQTLLSSVPAKTLHSYTLAHLASAPEPTLAALSSFFATLTPPPQLHCVRCHKDYVDVENGDRACLVPHDDDSAEVERVGRANRKVAGADGAMYETLWGCCGKTVEGDGDQGPPDGWCYEGKHTTDIKRARFRADSTPHDDKLVSCLRLNCHGVRSTLPRSTRAANKRPRPVEEDDDDDVSEGTEDSGVAEIAHGVSKMGKGKGKAKAKAKGKAKERDSGAEDADGSSLGKAASVKSTGDVAPVLKRRGRPPKRKDEAADADKSPKKARHTKGGSTVHVVIQRSPSHSARSRSRAKKDKGSGMDIADEKTDGEGKGRKRRKVAPAA